MEKQQSSFGNTGPNVRKKLKGNVKKIFLYFEYFVHLSNNCATINLTAKPTKLKIIMCGIKRAFFW
jgi:hypothetical protein